MNNALVVVDMLYDFIDGSLTCTEAEKAIAGTLKYIDSQTHGQGGEEHEILDTFPILFVCVCHPSDHSSFKEQGGIWPAHCVKGTRGGEIHDDLKPYAVEELTFLKGCDKTVEQYSGFEGVNNAGQSLEEILDLLDTTDVHVCGIATEFCVRNTCEDLLKAGFRVHLHKDCLAYVDHEGHLAAIEEMKAEGITVE